eukprot:CAMPEP_0181288386 /NCGR_PEP_ID=MMETSP1101-20121128/303_1 /TAXON_ID=46948 /ORGANISM="Rhodomonas abbreviata, Strain Caron Lab Isolate" /LENGTH=385 /DNA_ID=CAMNT_0023392501 /DNA_START=373 /DNA_END=1531 /DNA_ORIENTATION=-
MASMPGAVEEAASIPNRNVSMHAPGGVLPTSASDLLPSRLAAKIEEMVESPSESPVGKALQVAGALPDLAGVALAPRFAGEVCTIMGGIEGISRSSAGTAVGILIAPILAVSKIARLMGVEFTPQSLGLSEPDHYHSPATAAARLDCLELRLVKQHRHGAAAEAGGESSAPRRGWDAEAERAEGTEEEDVSYDEEEAVAADEGAAEEEDNLMCAVCQCDFEEGEYGLVFRRCKHAFHAKCLNTWLDRRHTCPCCRESVSNDMSDRIKGRRRFDSMRYAFRSSGEGQRESGSAGASAAAAAAAAAAVAAFADSDEHSDEAVAEPELLHGSEPPNSTDMDELEPEQSVDAMMEDVAGADEAGEDACNSLQDEAAWGDSSSSEMRGEA